MANKKEEMKDNPGFALGLENYKLMAIGFGIIIFGFILMVGGKSNDPNVFNPGIFSFTRITLAPLVLLTGYILEIYAIMKKTR
jgi:hypothetical protein